MKARIWFAFMLYGFAECVVRLSTALGEQNGLLFGIYLGGAVCCAGAALGLWEGLEERGRSPWAS